MIPFETKGSGVIKFSKVIALNNGNFLIEYLLQHISDTGKKSHFTLKQFCELELTPFPKDTEIEFTGILRENNYTDKDGNYKTHGLEVIATEIKNMEVF